MAEIQQLQIGNSNVIRNQPIAGVLEELLVEAARHAGIDTVRVFSGGQPGTHGKRLGSSRHDDGRAADITLAVGGKTLRFSDAKAQKRIVEFVRRAASLGANGVGAGVAYMGAERLHIGFGETPADHRCIAWGVGGRSSTAPKWLREAANAGWRHAVSPEVILTGPSSARDFGLHEIIARSGLNLRKGPGLAYGTSDVFPLGTSVTVLGFSTQDQSWAKVDIAGDGLVDGYMFSEFLAPLEAIEEE